MHAQAIYDELRQGARNAFSVPMAASMVQPLPLRSPPATSGEDWRFQCEVRHIQRLPVLERRPYLERVERQRGRNGRLALEEELSRLHELAKAQRLVGLNEPRPAALGNAQPGRSAHEPRDGGGQAQLRALRPHQGGRNAIR